ncbi:MAG: helix-turn-helix domain-containing protein [Oscillospiraceae bacterium]|nr:helix-turn-helix transcriptional regulator [Bacillota bacterium]
MKKYFTNEEVKAIGPRIRKLLDENGISVAEAAGELGIEVSYYYRMLKGTRPMTIDNLIAHCMYLDVSLGYLLAGDESLYWDDKNNVVPGEIEILIEKVVSSIENLDAHRRAEKAAKLGHRFSEMIEKMN